MNEHGPGITWLAERAGTSPEALVRDVPALLDALQGAARDAGGLAARLGSEDPPTRLRAEAEARAVRARFAAGAAPTPGERLGRAVAAALREQAARLRETGRRDSAPGA